MPMRRGRRLAVTWVALFVFLIVAIAYLRHGSRTFDPPARVHGSVFAVHGQVSDFYGARAGSRVLLFDAGADPEGHALDGLLGALGAGRNDVSDIFLTHGHGDHVAAAPLCTQAHLHGGPADVAMAARTAPYVPTLVRFMGLILPVPAVTIGDAMAAPKTIDVGAGVVRAFPLPGHTPGSTIYLWDGVLFVGDAMNFESGKLTFAFAPFTVDQKLDKANIAALPKTVPLDDVKVVCTGHGGCTPEGDTRRLLDDLIARAARS